MIGFSDLKPWLVEVNASPSLSASTVADGWMKEQVINDVLDVLVTYVAVKLGDVFEKTKRTTPSLATDKTECFVVRVHMGLVCL